MRIVILNGNPEDSADGFESYLAALSERLSANGHDVLTFPLHQMDNHFCTGCFGCWVKKPGECLQHDQFGYLCRAMIQSDFVLWASPLIFGYPSSLIKRVMDRSIPLISPFMEIVENEFHHARRYDRYPLLGLLYHPENQTTAEDVRILTALFQRTALNFKSRLALCQDSSTPLDNLVQMIENAERSTRSLPPYPTAIPGQVISPPTRLTLFNGSPRGKKGNTAILLGHLAHGFEAARSTNTTKPVDLIRVKDQESHLQEFEAAECVVLGFPLYTDAMPGSVKLFLETLAPLRGRVGNPPIGFLVQSGFPEAAQSRFVEQYLRRVADQLGSTYLGTMVKGGVEGIQMQPVRMTRSLFRHFHDLGASLALEGRFPATILSQLTRRDHLPLFAYPLIKLAIRTGMMDFYWDYQLKSNQVFDQRFNQPYASEDLSQRFQ